MVVEELVTTGRLFTFRVGPGRFAVLLEDVLGVQDPAENGAGAGRGVMFHGRSLAAVDARRIWWSGGGPPPAGNLSPAVIIVGRGGVSTALIVDRIEGIVEGVEMRPLPALLEPFARKVFSGITLHADGDRLLVDTAALTGAPLADARGGPREE